MRSALAAGVLGAAAATAPGAAAPIAFLVAEPAGSVVHGDSYVLVLEAPADVAHARALVQQGTAARLKRRRQPFDTLCAP